MKRKTPGSNAFDIFNNSILIILALSCVIPFIHVAAVSLSSGVATTAGAVGLWPVDFTLDSYEYVIQQSEFLRAFKNSVVRVLLGVSTSMLLVTLASYALSKSDKVFPGRTFFAWFFVVTMMVSGGLIPQYLVVSATGIRNTVWALILPHAVNVFNITILLNFFRQVPKELEESAFLDGAGQWRILLSIYLPLSIPALATLIIFSTVVQWNEWFSGIIYMDSLKDYPLQSYLRSILFNPNVDPFDVQQAEMVENISGRSFLAAQIMIATLPIILVYPYMQRYFIKGMTVGSLKG